MVLKPGVSTGLQRIMMISEKKVIFHFVKCVQRYSNR